MLDHGLPKNVAVSRLEGKILCHLALRIMKASHRVYGMQTLYMLRFEQSLMFGSRKPLEVDLLWWSVEVLPEIRVPLPVLDKLQVSA